MAETLIQFMVATFVSLGAVFIFIWAALSGHFTDVEKIAERAYRAEVEDDEPRTPNAA